MAARMKAERRRDRAGAICSSTLKVSSSTSISNCFICCPIGKNTVPHKTELPAAQIDGDDPERARRRVGAGRDHQAREQQEGERGRGDSEDRKSTRLNSSHT